MADTITVALRDDQWTLVASASGFVTNETVNKLVYRKAGSVPVNSVRDGHTLESTVGAFFQFTLSDSEMIYARSIGGAGKVAVTVEG